MLRHTHRSSGSGNDRYEQRTMHPIGGTAQMNGTEDSTIGSSLSPHRTHTPTSSSTSSEFMTSPFLPSVLTNSHKFDVRSVSREEFYQPTLERHIQMTVNALQQAKWRFLLQFGSLVIIALVSLIYWISTHIWYTGSSSDLSLLICGCSMVGLLGFVATGTATDRLHDVDAYTTSVNRWLQLFGLEWSDTKLIAECLPTQSASPTTRRHHTAATTKSHAEAAEYEARKRCGYETGWALATPNLPDPAALGINRESSTSSSSGLP